MTFSVTKSFLSTTVGLAYDRGMIRDLNEPVRRYVPTEHFESDHNAKITWRHLLNMNSEWQGEIFGKSDQVDHYRQIGIGADNSRKGQRRELREPGSLYEYNDVRVNALGYALLRRFRPARCIRKAAPTSSGARRSRMRTGSWLTRDRWWKGAARVSFPFCSSRPTNAWPSPSISILRD